MSKICNYIENKATNFIENFQDSAVQRSMIQAGKSSSRIDAVKNGFLALKTALTPSKPLNNKNLGALAECCLRLQVVVFCILCIAIGILRPSVYSLFNSNHLTHTPTDKSRQTNNTPELTNVVASSENPKKLPDESGKWIEGDGFRMQVTSIQDPPYIDLDILPETRVVQRDITTKKSFEETLETWKTEAGISEKEKTGRATAATEIQRVKNSSEACEFLHLNNLHLTSLPSCIAELNNLSQVDLSFNKFKAFPKELIPTPPFLIDLSFNELEELPNDLENMHSLCSLDLSDNQIRSIPLQVLGLPKLSIKMDKIGKGEHSTQKLPKNFTQNCYGIQWVPDADDIAKLSAELDDWKKKQPQEQGREEAATRILNVFKQGKQEYNTLNLSNLGLTSLPSCMKSLHFLTEINLSKNSLTEKDIEVLSKLKRLKTLRANKNKITEIPKSISDLKSLEVLILSENEIKVIPDEIGELKCIKEISLKGNQLRKIPNAFWSCGIHQNRGLIYATYNLYILDLSNNTDLEIIDETLIKNFGPDAALSIDPAKLSKQGNIVKENVKFFN